LAVVALAVVVREKAIELLEEHTSHHDAVILVVQLRNHEVAHARIRVLNGESTDRHTQGVVACSACEVKAEGVVLQIVVLTAGKVKATVAFRIASNLIVRDVVEVRLHLVVNLLGKTQTTEVNCELHGI